MKRIYRIFSIEKNEIVETDDCGEYIMFLAKEAPFNA